MLKNNTFKKVFNNFICIYIMGSTEPENRDWESEDYLQLMLKNIAQ